MDCIFGFFFERFSPGPSQVIQAAISSFVFNESSRGQSIEKLIDFAAGPDAETLVDLLRRQLEPRWSDADHDIRERLTIQIFACIESLHFLTLCAKDRKLLDLLDYHLRACTFIDAAGTKQLLLARRIQCWLDQIMQQNPFERDSLSSFADLQRKYISAWRDIDHVLQTSQILRRPRARIETSGGILTLRPVVQHALPSYQAKRVYLSKEELEKTLSQADILCFDILKMLLRPVENETLITAAIATAKKTKLRLAQFSNLQVRTPYQTRHKI